MAAGSLKSSLVKQEGALDLPQRSRSCSQQHKVTENNRLCACACACMSGVRVCMCVCACVYIID